MYIAEWIEPMLEDRTSDKGEFTVATLSMTTGHLSLLKIERRRHAFRQHTQAIRSGNPSHVYGPDGMRIV